MAFLRTKPPDAIATRNPHHTHHTKNGDKNGSADNKDRAREASNGVTCSAQCVSSRRVSISTAPADKQQRAWWAVTPRSLTLLCCYLSLLRC